MRSDRAHAWVAHNTGFKYAQVLVCMYSILHIYIYIYRDIIVRVFVCIYISILYILYTYVGILWLCISPSVKCYQRIIFIEDVIGSWKLSSLHRPPNNLSVYLLRNGLHL